MPVMTYKLVFATLVFFAQVSFAQLVEVSGQAVIYNDDIIDARYRATEQALKQAVLQANAKVITNDSLINGAINSHSSLTGIGRTQNSNIVNEVRDGDILTVTLMTDVTADNVCSNGSTNQYRKKIGITSFALQTPQQANLGAVHNIVRLLPRDLSQEINKQGFLHSLAATNIQLHPDTINAPTSFNNDGSLTQISRIGENLDVQYVVAGVIRDLSATNDYQPNQEKKFSNFKSPDKEEYETRNLALDIYLYDSFSGALLFEQNYYESGEWDISRYKKIGYGSPQFWNTKFGESVQRTLQQAATDASLKLKCQPFISNIFRVEGNRVHINAGSIAGIKIGDKLQAYRRYEVFNQRQDNLNQLNNANINVIIKQVQPNFSIGELSADTQILNIQQQDVVIAW